MFTRLSTRIRVFSDFIRKYPAFSSVVLIPLGIFEVFLLWLFGPSWALLSVMAGILLPVGLMLYYQSTYEKELSARSLGENSHDIWRVHLNQVYIGSMSDRDFATILKSVYFDYKIVIAQVFFVLKAVWRSTMWSIVQLPVLWAWLALIYIALVPEPGALTTVTRSQVSAAIPALVGFSVLFMQAFRFFLAVLSSRLDTLFLCQFEEAVNEKIRRLLECPADGALRVSLDVRPKIFTETSSVIVARLR